MTATGPLFLRPIPQAASYAAGATLEAVSRNLAFEAITRYDLADEVLDAEASALAPMLRRLGINSVIYQCCDGWTTIPVDRISEVLTSDLPESELTAWVGVYSPMDQTFRSADPPFELEFSHESQVHVRANDPALLDPFWTRWKENGLAFGRRVDAEWYWEDD